MKKIFVSLSIIGVVAAIAIGGTIAYFSDTETSTGNTLSAGVLDLRVDSMGSYHNEKFIVDSSWFPPRDLTDEKFYTVSDFKPGDRVKLNISVHIDDNPAWICLLGNDKQDNENGLLEPEMDAEDDTPDEGELSKNIDLLAWIDTDLDGHIDPGERVLADSFFDVFFEISIPVRDSTTGTGPLTPEIPVEIISMDLCGGTHFIHPSTGAISCDGASMGNENQSDSLRGSIILYAEQHRNNPNFLCNPPPGSG